MTLTHCLSSLAISVSTLALVTAPYAAPAHHQPLHFNKIMVVIFENMSYAEIKNEPTFKKLVEYSGHTLDENGKLLRLSNAKPGLDVSGNGYAFFSSYFNNHNGGTEPTRPSQPNYIAMTSGSIQGIKDNDNHDIDADNLGMELNDAGVSWKVYAEDLPDPKAAMILDVSKSPVNSLIAPAFIPDANKTEAENDMAEQTYFANFKKTHHAGDAEKNGYSAASGCFIGASNVDSGGGQDDGYKRKHEPFISYLNIQKNIANCKYIINATHLTADINKMADVTFYIPNQIDDGHNGTLAQRTTNANAFLSRMMGTDPKTGNPLPDAANAPFQKFMAQNGLLVITFDEPSVTGNPDKTIYTLLAGSMINSGAYPNNEGKNLPVCYPAKDQQTRYAEDKNGKYDPAHCNHYNLLKMIEANWILRGLQAKNTSAGYKYALSLDNGIPGLWKK